MGQNHSEAIFDAMLTIACKEVAARNIAELPDASEIDYTFSDEFEKRMNQLIRKQSKPLRRQKTLRYIGRFAAVLVIMMAIGFSAVMSVSALRREILNTILEYGDNYLGFRFGSADTDLPSNSIPYPSYVPEGFWEETTKVLGNMTDVRYINESNVRIVYSVIRKSESFAMNIDNEHSQPRTVIKNGVSYTIMDGTASGYGCYVIWENSEYLYMVFGEYNADELFAMAVSATE